MIAFEMRALPPQHRTPHVPLIAGNDISVASSCRLVPCFLNKSELLFSSGFMFNSSHFMHSPSSCVVDEAWQEAGLPVPPEEAVAAGWETVLKFIREVSSACLGV